MNYSLESFYQTLYGDCDYGGIVVCEPTTYERDGLEKPTYNRIGWYRDINQAIASIKDKRDAYIKVNCISRGVLDRFNAIGGKSEVVAINAFSLDVDSDSKSHADEKKKYGSRQQILAAFAEILPPTITVNSDGCEKGLHFYFCLKKPILVSDLEHFNRLNAIAERVYRYVLSKVDFAIDSTYGLERLLRAPGSIRKSGNRVEVLEIADHRYTLDDFEKLTEHIRLADEEAEKKKTAERESRACNADDKRTEFVISDYLDSIGARTVGQYLGLHGWIQKGSEWFHPASKSGAKSAVSYSQADGTEGVTVYSGAIKGLEPLKWYSREMLFVCMEHEGDWTAAARFCHKEFEKDTEQVSDEVIRDLNKSRDHEPAKEAADSVTKDQTDKPTAKPAEDAVTFPGGSYLTKFLERLNARQFDTLIEQYTALQGIEVGYGLITVIGAPPGQGKTALAMQIAFDGLEIQANDPNKQKQMRVVVANAETTFDSLLRREVSRATGIKSDAIRFGNLTEIDFENINKKVVEMMPRFQRVEILAEPCNLVQLCKLKDSEPGLVIVDYLQKFSPKGDPRQGANEVMAELRGLAKRGWAVIALSATTRTNGKGGSGHDSKSLNQASFRESGEIEFNADSAYLLVDNGAWDGKEWHRDMTLKCVKNRHGAKEDFALLFHMPKQTFKAKPATTASTCANYEPSFDTYSKNPFAAAGANL